MSDAQTNQGAVTAPARCRACSISFSKRASVKEIIGASAVSMVKPGKIIKICIAGHKAGLSGYFAGSGRHSRSLLDLWMAARNCDFKTALREAAAWLGCVVKRRICERSPSFYLFFRHSMLRLLLQSES